LAGARPRVNAPLTCTQGEYDTPVQYMPVVTILSSRQRFARWWMPAWLVGGRALGMLAK